MIYSLLEQIWGGEQRVLATILRTEGHTYKKPGHRALFAVGEPFPVYGNLGSLCVDQEILNAAARAWESGKPEVLTIDTSDPHDIETGYGTFCGGKMDLLIEPLLDAQKAAWAEIESRLRAGNTVHLVHDLASGRLDLHDDDPTATSGTYVDSFRPPATLVIVGATPLTRQVIDCVADMDFDVHVNDWRQAHLDRFAELPNVTLHGDPPPMEGKTHVLVLSHSFTHDIEALEHALHSTGGYIGLLSSGTRRDHMFAELEKRGIEASSLKRVSSPVGINIGARTDAEIAVSIVAELTRFIHK